MTTPEGAVKAYLKTECEKRGWACLALEYPHKPGWPDRAVLLNGGVVAFVEVKASSTKHVSAHIRNQKSCMTWLHIRGHFAGFAVDKEGVDRVISMIPYAPSKAVNYGIPTFDDI